VPVRGPQPVKLDHSHMSEDKIHYDILAKEALQGIIRSVLQRVQRRGLPGEHHFYVTFDTTAPGTILSKRLKEQYPEEMTIVLQHQFWDLMVYDDRFEVKLSFHTVPERLVVPFQAIKTFVDPSVPFGFAPNIFAPLGPREAAPITAVPESEDGQDLSALPKPSIPADTAVEPASAEPEKPVEESEPEQESAKVVELDLFRKK